MTPELAYSIRSKHISLGYFFKEKLYMEKDFPAGAPELSSSPKALGMSRADLWSLAGIVAIEYSVNENNLACTAANLPWTRRGTGARVNSFFIDHIKINQIRMREIYFYHFLI